MSRSFIAPNGRIIRRGSRGRFRRTTLVDFGISNSELADGPMKCAYCGHVWNPILKSGHCPECGSQAKS